MPKKESTIKKDWTLLKDELGWNDVGGRLLANIAKGIYNHEAVLREYVQNACDAYNMLSEEADSPLIVVTAEDTHIAIQDFGIGMDEDHIRSVKKVAVSNKTDFEDVVGFRGIGVWAGLQACERLEIETTKFGVDKKYRLIIDFAAISSKLDANINIKELIEPHYTLAVSPAEADDHYTRTVLHGILQGYEKLLDVDELKRIASTILPCRLDPKGPYTSEIQAITSKAAGYRDYIIKVGTDEVFRQFPSDEFDAPKEHTISNDKGEELARIWYCATKKGSMEDAGFQLRVRNFGVGPRNIYNQPQGHSYGVFDGVELGGTFKLDWFFGEIHVTNNSIRPNTPRNDLEIDFQARTLITYIRSFYSRRLAEANARSEYNAYAKALDQGEALASKISKEKTADVDQAVLAEIIKKLEKSLNKTKGIANAEKDIIVRDLLKRPVFVNRRRSVLAKLKKAVVETPKPKSSKPASTRTKKTATLNNNTKKASATKEELISDIIALIEERIGPDHEEFSSLCESITQLITNFEESNA